MKHAIASFSIILAFSACSHLPKPAVDMDDQPAKQPAIGNQPTEQPAVRPVATAKAVEPDWSEPAPPAPATGQAQGPDSSVGPGCAQPQRPGGRPSMANADCQRASNHCLPDGTVFAPSIRGLVAPVFQCGGAWYDWSSLEPAEAPYYQSRSIRDEEIIAGAEIIYYVPNTARTKVPPSKAQAIGSHWHIGTISRVDTRLRELYVDKRAVPVSFEAARLILK